MKLMVTQFAKVVSYGTCRLRYVQNTMSKGEPLHMYYMVVPSEAADVQLASVI